MNGDLSKKQSYSYQDLARLEGIRPGMESELEERLDKALNYEIRIVAGNSNRPRGEQIADILRVKITDADIKTFSDGEVYVSIKENIRGRDVFVIQSTCPPVNDNLMELLVIIDALKRSSARRITAVMPYYGYGRQDRKVAPRVPITARLVADLIVAAGAHRVLAFELHAGQIQGFFNIPVDHMFAIPVFIDHLFQSGLPERPVIVSPDAGGMERARAFAKRLNCSLAIIDKRRSGPNQAHVMHVIGEVAGMDAIIVDDMVDTAGTLTEAAKAVKQHGARTVSACCVHPVLSGPAIERIQNSPLDRLVVTDSIPLPPEKRISKIDVVSVSVLIAETIRRIHREESVSKLFDE